MQIKNIKTNKIINISDDFIIRTDDFISIEIGNGFKWGHHAHTCNDCNAFLSSFGKNDDEWILIYDEYKLSHLILTNEFGRINDYFNNLHQYECSDNFYGTRIKLKTESIEITEEELKRQADDENYELCTKLKYSLLKKFQDKL